MSCQDPDKRWGSTACWCLLCQPPMPMTGWLWPMAPAPDRTVPADATATDLVSRASILRLIDEELSRLPQTAMPEDWRSSLAYRLLSRLRNAITAGATS